MLHSFHRLQHDLPRIHPEALEEYRTWMAEAHPITPQEATFLHHEEDLVTTGQSRHALQFHRPDQKSTLQVVIMTVAGSIMLPLLAFSVIPSYLPRLFVVVFTGLVLAGIYQMGEGHKVFRPEEIRSCSVVYLAIMLISAFTVP